jgi:hypothetical protein
MKKRANKYLLSLFFLLAISSGVGTGYIWGTSRVVKIMSVVFCKIGMPT